MTLNHIIGKSEPGYQFEYMEGAAYKLTTHELIRLKDGIEMLHRQIKDAPAAWRYFDGAVHAIMAKSRKKRS